VYSRLLQPPARQSFFLFGPRGTGKTAWVRRTFPDAPYFDLLDAAVYTRLLASPDQLAERIPKDHRGWVVVDEVQTRCGPPRRGRHPHGAAMNRLAGPASFSCPSRGVLPARRRTAGAR